MRIADFCMIADCPPRRVNFLRIAPRRTRALIVRAFLGIGLLTGCSPQDAPPTAASAPAKPIESTIQRGPVRMLVRVQKDRVMVAEPLTLLLTVTAPEGIDIKPP